MRPAVLLLALGLVAGCSSQPDSPALPVPTRLSPTVTPSATPAALPSPRETGVAGEVERAVLAYYAGINEMFRTSSTAPYRATFTADCAGCLAFEKTVADVLAKGQRIEGAEDRITSLTVTPGSSSTAGASVRFTVSAYRLVGEDGQQVEEYDQSEGAVTMQLFRQPGGGYKVVGVQDALAS